MFHTQLVKIEPTLKIDYFWDLSAFQSAARRIANLLGKYSSWSIAHVVYFYKKKCPLKRERTLDLQLSEQNIQHFKNQSMRDSDAKFMMMRRRLILRLYNKIK